MTGDAHDSPMNPTCSVVLAVDVPDAGQPPPGVVPEVMPSDTAHTPPAERPLPALMAMLLGWFRPASTARRTEHVSLLVAWGMHWLGALLTFMVVVAIVGAIESAMRQPSRGVIGETAHLIGEMIEQVARYPEEASLVIFGTIMFIEVSFVMVALLLQAWGALDESLGASCGNALRQLWLHTADGIPAIIVIGLLCIPAFQAHRDFYQNRSQLDAAMARVPVPSLASNATQKEIIEYNRRFQEYHAAIRDLSRNWDNRPRPWYVRYDEELLVAVGFLFGFHILWLWFRAIGARRSAPPIVRPPMCEPCGYTLVGLPFAGRCPECGEQVMTSLSPDVRPGAPWQLRRSIGGQEAYWATMWEFFLRPQDLGRRLITRVRQVDHRMFLALHLLPTFMLGWIGLICAYVADMGRMPFERDPEVFWMGGPLTGSIAVILMLLIETGSAGLVALMLVAERKRNLSATAMQAAAYGTPLLMLALVASGSSIVLIMLSERVIRDLARSWMIGSELLVLIIWAAPTLVGLLFYFIRIHRATAAARYANR